MYLAAMESSVGLDRCERDWETRGCKLRSTMRAFYDAMGLDFGGAWSTLARAASSAEVDAGVHIQLWLHFQIRTTVDNQ
jgi:hypothetical protein